MPASDLNRYAAFRRWHLAEPEEGAKPEPNTELAGAQVWVVHFAGRDWEGRFVRPAYLCLTEAEAEAKMVVGEVAGPRPKASRLGFEWYINARIEAVALAHALQDETLELLLHRRLKRLAAYTPEAYERATQHHVCLHEGGIAVLLLKGDQLTQPAHPRDRWPTELRWGQPLVVWNEAGLVGVMGPDGQLLVPCRFAALRSGLSGKRLLALREPLAPITEPLARNAFTRFCCDVIDSHTGQRINPPGTSVLLGSLGHDGECVAVMDDDGRPGPVRVGFMNSDGQWLGGCRLASVLMFHGGLAAVQEPETLRWGYLDKTDQVVIAPQYLWPGFFNGKRAIVQAPLPDAASDERTQPRGGAQAAAWFVINPGGKTITGPWACIDHAPNDHFVVQALEDTGSERWSLLYDNGTLLLEREPVPPEDTAEHRDLDATDKAAQHLNRLWQQRRRSLALSLRGLPPNERVAQYRPTTERDLISLGLWGQRVRCTKPVQSAALGEGTKPESYLKCHYPVTLSIFSLAAETPVTFTRDDGSTVCVGVPWGDLELYDADATNKTD
jgi:hypothetical protein